MDLVASVTYGWPSDSADAPSAISLYRSCLIQSDNDLNNDQIDVSKLEAELTSNTTITRLDELFRRSSDGFNKIKLFIAALTELPIEKNMAGPLVCEFDIFSYSFLSHSKNIDLIVPLLPSDDSRHGQFSKILSKWHTDLNSLEYFERKGTDLPSNCHFNTVDYLNLRKIITRASGRDELRTLATLLISGPSNPKQLKEELGLSDQLVSRMLHTLKKIDIIQRTNKTDGNEFENTNFFQIKKSKLALVIFCLRERLGLDILPEQIGG